MPLKDGESFINSRLSGRALPEPGAAAGTYKPFVRRRNLLAVSGQLPIKDGEVAYRGALRGHHDIRKGVAAAELAVLKPTRPAQQGPGGRSGKAGRVPEARGFCRRRSFFYLPLQSNGRRFSVAQTGPGEKGRSRQGGYGGNRPAFRRHRRGGGTIRRRGLSVRYLLI